MGGGHRSLARSEAGAHRPDSTRRALRRPADHGRPDGGEHDRARMARRGGHLRSRSVRPQSRPRRRGPVPDGLHDPVLDVADPAAIRAGAAAMSALKRMRTRNQVILGLLVYMALLIALGVAFGNAGRNNEYQPQNEFKLDPWVKIKIGSLDLSINKAVLYLFITCALTAWVMIYIARRMQDRPNRVQTAVEQTF